MIEIRRAADRYVTEQPGIASWHCFAAGPHYDAANVAFGPVVGVDEHLVDPGAGFDWHGHRGVQIVSWVVEGTLRHQDANGVDCCVSPGEVSVQITGSGIRHRETNPSDVQPLRFVQTTLLDEPSLDVAGGAFTVLRDCRREQLPAASFVHLYVTAGTFGVGGHQLLPGDSLRVTAQAVAVDGTGELLVVRVEV